MKKIILFILLATLFLYADTNKLYLFSKSSSNSVELKWFLKNYTSSYIYKIYRAKKGEKLKYIATIKPATIGQLKRRGYDDDYIFMIYPLRNTKSVDQLISTLKILPKSSVFRMLRAIQENSFAKNLGHYFIDKMVKKNSMYLYKVVAYKDKKRVLSKMVVVVTQPYKKMRDIMWVKAKPANEGVELSWDTQGDFSFYNIYRKLKGEKKYKKLNKLPIYIERNFAQKAKALYIDSDIKENSFASYYITKMDMFYKEGKPSKKIKIKYIKHTPIRKVQKLFVNVNKKGAILRWSKVANSLGYNVYKSPTYQGVYNKLNKKPISKNYYFDKNYVPAKASYYFVTAVNLKAESSPSSIVMAFSRDTTPPARVKGLKARSEPSKVILKWMKSREKDLLGYNVYVSMDMNKKEWSLVNKKPIRINSFIHNRAKTLSRFPYYYRVCAVDKALNESVPSKIVEIKLPDVTPPSQPILKRYKAYANKIVLEWAQVIVYDFDHYNVYKKLGKKWVKLNKKPIFKTYFQDLNPKIGKNIYAITAVDNSKNESKIKKMIVVHLRDKIAPIIKKFKIKRVKDGILISFECKDRDYSGFEVYRSSGDILRYLNVSNFIKRKKSFLDRNIAKKAHYFYKIAVYDKNGNVSQSKVVEIRLKKK